MHLTLCEDHQWPLFVHSFILCTQTVHPLISYFLMRWMAGLLKTTETTLYESWLQVIYIELCNKNKWELMQSAHVVHICKRIDIMTPWVSSSHLWPALGLYWYIASQLELGIFPRFTMVSNSISNGLVKDQQCIASSTIPASFYHYESLSNSAGIDLLYFPSTVQGKIIAWDQCFTLSLHHGFPKKSDWMIAIIEHYIRVYVLQLQVNLCLPVAFILDPMGHVFPWQPSYLAQPPSMQTEQLPGRWRGKCEMRCKEANQRVSVI